MQSTLVIIPIFNDWEPCSQLLRRLDDLLAQEYGAHPGSGLEVMLINDGSTEPCPEEVFAGPFQCIEGVHVLDLAINQGHQRALALGLYAARDFFEDKRHLLLMDGDGEDKPEDVLRLLARYHELGEEQLVFARRTRRSESLLFRVCYWTYRSLFKFATGREIRFGNFSVMHARHADALLACPEIWLNYAAAVQKRRVPYVQHPTDRGYRIAGKAKMNFGSLVTHGLSGIAVYNDILGVRVLLATLCTGTVLVALLVATLMFPLLFPDQPFPEWAPYSVGLLLILLFQALTLCLSFAFSVLGHRTTSTFLPARDAAYYIKGMRIIYGTAKGKVQDIG